MSAEDQSNIFADCVFDECEGADDMLCTHAEYMVFVCFNTYGVDIQNWRTNAFCRMYPVGLLLALANPPLPGIVLIVGEI